jgi:hypothetical protein
MQTDIEIIDDPLTDTKEKIRALARLQMSQLQDVSNEVRKIKSLQEKQTGLVVALYSFFSTGWTEIKAGFAEFVGRIKKVRLEDVTNSSKDSLEK